MKRFEYDISIHDAKAFQQFVYLCTGTGECSPELVPGQQTDKLKDMLDNQGREGWELVQLVFDQKGVVAIWKREK